MSTEHHIVHRRVGRPRVSEDPLIGTSFRLTREELDFLDATAAELGAQSRNEALRIIINDALTAGMPHERRGKGKRDVV